MPRRAKRYGVNTPKPVAPGGKTTYSRASSLARPRESSTKRGYGWRWRKASKAYLAEHPLCVECKKRKLVVGATCVDHIVPHKGDQKLFWDSEKNWQALCATCHSRKTASRDGGMGNPIKTDEESK